MNTVTHANNFSLQRDVKRSPSPLPIPKVIFNQVTTYLNPTEQNNLSLVCKDFYFKEFEKSINRIGSILIAFLNEINENKKLDLLIDDLRTIIFNFKNLRFNDQKNSSIISNHFCNEVINILFKAHLIFPCNKINKFYFEENRNSEFKSLYIFFNIVITNFNRVNEMFKFLLEKGKVREAKELALNQKDEHFNRELLMKINDFQNFQLIADSNIFLPEIHKQRDNIFLIETLSIYFINQENPEKAYNIYADKASIPDELMLKILLLYVKKGQSKKALKLIRKNNLNYGPFLEIYSEIIKFKIKNKKLENAVELAKNLLENYRIFHPMLLCIQAYINLAQMNKALTLESYTSKSLKNYYQRVFKLKFFNEVAQHHMSKVNLNRLWKAFSNNQTCKELFICKLFDNNNEIALKFKLLYEKDLVSEDIVLSETNFYLRNKKFKKIKILLRNIPYYSKVMHVISEYILRNANEYDSYRSFQRFFSNKNIIHQKFVEMITTLQKTDFPLTIKILMKQNVVKRKAIWNIFISVIQAIRKKKPDERAKLSSLLLAENTHFSQKVKKLLEA